MFAGTCLRSRPSSPLPNGSKELPPGFRACRGFSYEAFSYTGQERKARAIRLIVETIYLIARISPRRHSIEGGLS